MGLQQIFDVYGEKTAENFVWSPNYFFVLES